LTTGVPCRLCGHPALDMVIDFGAHPVTGSLLDSRRQALSVPRYRLALGRCGVCELVQQATTGFESDLVRVYDSYQPTYGSSSRVSAYLEDLVARFENDGARGSAIAVEIGSNDGRGLDALASAGFRPVGVEPAKALAVQCAERNRDVMNCYLDTAAAAELVQRYGRARLVLTRHTLEHAFEPVAFMQAVASLLSPAGRVVVEVPYLPSQMERGHFEGMALQHISYFTARTLEALADRAGLRLRDAWLVDQDGGSIVAVMSPPGKWESSSRASQLLALEESASAEIIEHWESFVTRFRICQRSVGRFLDDMHAAGKIVDGYGAGGKGQNLLSLLGVSKGQLRQIYDDTPGAEGRYTPGSGVRVTSRDGFQGRLADVLLITATTHISEIVAKERSRAHPHQVLVGTIPGFGVLDES